jgi:hypothetical protein
MKEIVAVPVPGEVADEKVDEETDARRTNSHTAKWTTIPPKHAEEESALKTTQTTAIQTPPGMTSRDATTAVSQDISKSTSSTSNLHGINATRSTNEQHLPRLLQQEIAT